MFVYPRQLIETGMWLHKVHERQAGHNATSRLEWDDRPGLVGPDELVRVRPDHENITELRGLLQEKQVPDVKQVPATGGVDHPPAHFGITHSLP